MGATKTRTMKNKHATNKSGISGSKASKSGPSDGIVTKKREANRPSGKQIMKKSLADMLKRKKKTYAEKDLDIPQLNTVTPIGVTKPKGKKKGKVFVDDKESMSTILALVQADKEGQIESKMIKARQMEEIREARKAEAEKKEADRKSKLDETKESLRRKRKRTGRPSSGGDDDAGVSEVTSAGSKAAKPKRKSVSFA